MSYNTFGAPDWEITPVGKTALEQALARHLSRAVAVENIVFAEPDPLSTAVGNGFAPRRGTVTTRGGRGEENRVDLFFKIPGEREVEALVLGHRLGMKHQPRILVSSLDIKSNGVESRALCYLFVPGQALGNGADGNPFTADSLPEGIVADMAILHASTAGHAEAYLRRGYTFVSRESLIEASVDDTAAYLDLPGMSAEAGALLSRATAVSAEAVELAAGEGPVVVHGELEPPNVVVGADGSGTLVDWGEMGLGWAALDLASCLGYEQLALYRKTAGDRNPSWNPPDERALAAARLVHALVHLKRFVRDSGGQPPSAVSVGALVGRLDETLTRL
ncbi:MAG TPA: phosphotransferase [bacterium]|nr:phosphotransferase [bacterium]